MSALYFHFGN